MTLGAWIERYGWLVAAFGALTATAGDLGQLWVVNAARPQLLVPTPPRETIVFATIAGAVGIPLYGIGYYVRARQAWRNASTRAAVVTVAGVAFAALGASVHTATGVLIANDIGGIADGLDPLQGVLSSGALVLTLWGLAAAALLLAAISEASLPQRPTARVFNPLVLTLVFTAAAPVTGTPWRDFIGPAAVNIAHLVFFLWLGMHDRHRAGRHHPLL